MIEIYNNILVSYADLKVQCYADELSEVQRGRAVLVSLANGAISEFRLGSG